MTVYYNENDPRAAAWLRELMRAGAIPEGVVDERSIEDIPPADLAGFLQCHFFAGIGGWAYALRLAGWPDDRAVWTGSCPCQPYSQAGARKGADDPRHLWPHWRWLIDQRRPVTVFGEQVAGPDGREWLAGVRADLDLLEYAFGATDLCAAGVGAPHVRQRLYWMAHSDGGDTGAEGIQRGGQHGQRSPNGRLGGWMGDAGCEGTGRDTGAVSRAEAESDSEGLPARRIGDGAVATSAARRVGDADDQGREGRIVLPERADEWAPWASGLDRWIPCGDGKVRRLEPGLQPLVDGLPDRMGLIRGYGNAIVPQVAATFIEAAIDSLPHRES